jgi:predicted dehydrogenase
MGMKIAFVGCGYVFDIYMRSKWAHPELEVCGVYDIDNARANTVHKYYGFKLYPNYESLLDDPSVEIVINLTNIESHYEVSKRALEAGKHVYSEKPLSKNLYQTRELFALAESRGLVFTGAPCNLYCDAISTMWKAIRDGAIGKPVLVLAELNDSPIHLQHMDKVTSPTGAPFPYVEEFQEGCTVEHIGYHLVWICALFGPVISLTAFSKLLIEHKTETPLSPSDTPDYSVACLNFQNGVTARITCSWVAPRDHRMRIIGLEGEIFADSYCHDQTPVRLERFSTVSLVARKSFHLRTQPLLGRLFGISGRRIPLIRRWKSHAVREERGAGRSIKQKLISWIRSREIYAQDKFLGIAEMTRAIRLNRPQPMPPDFQMHINEITLLVQHSGPEGIAIKPTTCFKPFEPLPEIVKYPYDYRTSYRQCFFEKVLTNFVMALRRS